MTMVYKKKPSKYAGRIIHLGGNIGSGKTHFILTIAKLFGNKIHIIDEKLMTRKLKKYYSGVQINEKNVGFAFQMEKLQSRFEDYQKAMKWVDAGDTVIIDQSFWSDSIYAHANGPLSKYQVNINKVNMLLYQKKRAQLMKQCYLPDLIIVLNCSPEICFKIRIPLRKKKRPWEQNGKVALKYLEELQRWLKDWIELMRHSDDTTVKELDWTYFGVDLGLTMSKTSTDIKTVKIKKNIENLLWIFPIFRESFN